MLLRLTFFVLLACATTACSTVAVDRAQGVAVTGSAYVVTMKKVNDLALDESISFSADVLPDMPRDADTLNAVTQELIQRAQLIADAQKYFDGLDDYFSALEALASDDQSAATAKALGDVAESLKNSPVELKLTDAKRDALTGLAAYIDKQVHAVAVEKALKRDADTIAQALAVSEKMLDEQIRWITFRERLVRQKAYNDTVQKPFVAGDTLGTDWKKSWSDYIRTPPTIALLTDAKKASADMQKAWIDVLRGQYSFAEIQASLKNVQAGLDAANALKDANKPTPASAGTSP